MSTANSSNEVASISPDTPVENSTAPAVVESDDDLPDLEPVTLTDTKESEEKAHVNPNYTSQFPSFLSTLFFSSILI